MKLQLKNIFLALCLIFALSACSDSDNPSSEMTVERLAVLTANSAQGTTFAVANDNGTENAILLTASQAVESDKVSVGNALLIAYKVGSPSNLNDSKINLIGYYPFTNLSASTADKKDLAGWNTTSVYLLSTMVIAGRLIVYAGLPYSTTSRDLGLVIDRATLSDEIPTAYLVHSLADQSATFVRRYYLGFDLSKLVATYGFTKLRVCVNDSNLNRDSFTINLNENKL